MQIVNATYNNSYINPATTVPSILSLQRLFNVGGSFNIQSTTGYLCVQPSSLAYLDIRQQGAISLTQSANNTLTSYWQVSRTGKYKINAFFNLYSGAVAYSPQFSLWNITDSVSIIWSASTINAGQNLDNTLVGVVDLVQGKSYTLDFGNGTSFAGQQVRSFGLIVEEILDVSADTFNFSSASLTPLTIQNISTGQSAIALKGSSGLVSWRIRTDASNNLIFE